MIHDYHPKEYFNVMGSHSACLEIQSGDVVRTTTVDAHGFGESGIALSKPPNPMTGPFSVAGAEPGDSLAVSIERIEPSRDTAWTSPSLAPHVLDAELIDRYLELMESTDPPEGTVTWKIDTGQNRAFVGRPTDGKRFLSVPLAPMLGCIGTAPEEGQVISTRTSGRHGGNMDYVGNREGATLYFPVFVPGAMLYLGDGHATQGHGEIGGTGTETSMKVQFSVELRKGRTIGLPRGESDTHIFTLGNARPLDQALQHATSEMFFWLTSDFGFDAGTASLLLAQTVEYEVGNVFDPAYTMVCKMAKSYLG